MVGGHANFPCQPQFSSVCTLRYFISIILIHYKLQHLNALANWQELGTLNRSPFFCWLCRMFETFSYLPPLSDDQIARQVDYIVNNGWTPCLEFSEPEKAYVDSSTTGRMGAVTSVSI